MAGGKTATRDEASLPKEPVRSHEGEQVDEAETGSRMRRNLFLLGLPILFLVFSFIPSPEWRVDLWSKARFGYPRLFGIWTPTAFGAFWLLGFPLYALAGCFFAGRRVRRIGNALLACWIASTLVVLALGAYLSARPEAMPHDALRYFPFHGAYLFPSGNPYFRSDPELRLVHPPGLTMRSRVDFGQTGDLDWPYRVPEPKPRFAGLEIEAVRRFNDFGFPAEFGRFDGEPPEPEVVFLGDSFTVGYNVPADSTWPALLLDRLKRARMIGRSSDEPDPMKLGSVFAAAGFTPGEGLRALRKFAPEAAPKIVLALFYEGNDLNDARTHWEFRRDGTPPEMPYRWALDFVSPVWPEKNPIHAMLAWLFAPTDLRFRAQDRGYQWLDRKRDPRSDVYAGITFIRTAPPVELGGLNRSQYAAAPLQVELGNSTWPLVVSPEFVELLHAESSPTTGTLGWHAIEETFRELEEYSKGTGTRVFVALAPSKIHVHWPHFKEGELEREDIYKTVWWYSSADNSVLQRASEEGSWRPMFEEHAESFARALEEEASRHGLPFLDLTPGLRRVAQQREDLLYFPYDHHWSPAGYEAAAELLGDFIIGELAPRTEASEPKPESPRAHDERTSTAR